MPKAPKKTTNRSGAAREFQRRMGVTGPPTGTNGSTTILPTDQGVEIAQVPTTSAVNTPIAPRPTSPSLSANTRLRSSGTAATAVPRAGSATRPAAPLYGGPLGARARGAQAAAFTVEDELSYIKGDIRRLVIIAIVNFVILGVLTALFYAGVFG